MSILSVVRGVSGVSSVENQLKVSSRIPDETVLIGVQRKIDSHPKYKDISASVRDGSVALTGDAANFEHVDALLSSLLMLPGVESVDSSVTVQGKAYPREMAR